MRCSRNGGARLALGVLLLAASSSGWAEQKQTVAAKETIWPAEQIQFKPVLPGVSKAILWGDPQKGGYGALTKFAKGTKNASHTHSHDIKIVIVSGTMLSDFGSGQKRLGPGSYIFEPAGAKHTNGATDDADCVFFEESDSPFDIQWVK